MQERPLDVSTLLRRAEHPFGHKQVVTATANGEMRVSWAQLAGRARRLMGALDALEVPRHARVATLGWNTQRHTELYLAVPTGGRVLHTLNHRLFDDEITYIVNDAADDVIFVDRSLLPRAWPLVDRFASVRKVVVMDDGGAEPIPDDPRIVDYEAILDQAPDSVSNVSVDENDAASLCYTSGTTGRPKGVLYSHRSIVLHALLLQGVDSFAISEADVVMPIVPMFHVNAWGLPYAAMLAGSNLILPGPAMGPESLLRLMERHRVTFSAGVPTIWRGMTPFLSDTDLDSLRMVVCGGGAVPDALSRTWQEQTGTPLTNAWGMTETSPVVTCSRLATAHTGLDPDAARLIIGSPGPSLPLTEIRVVDDEGRQIARDGNSAGELQVAGATIAASYFGEDPGRASFTADGWLRTGDVGSINEYGYLQIIDRTKDLVKSGGEWISSVALENEIMSHPDVHEAAVIAVTDERWGERPLAFVVPVAGRIINEKALRAHLSKRVASWWIPEQICILDDIPKTSTGKFSKRSLREMARARAADADVIPGRHAQ